MKKTFECPFCGNGYPYEAIKNHLDKECKAAKKTLKFSPDLVPLILNGEKVSTWRLFDDKDLKVGDTVIFVKRPELVSFALAQLTAVTEKRLGDLTNEDKQGHETFASDKEMYKQYTEYYKTPVCPNTTVKLIRFEIMARL